MLYLQISVYSPFGKLSMTIAQQHPAKSTYHFLSIHHSLYTPGVSGWLGIARSGVPPNLVGFYFSRYRESRLIANLAELTILSQRLRGLLELLVQSVVAEITTLS
jgi:hypothetical protein